MFSIKFQRKYAPDRSGPEKHQKRRLLDGDRQSGRHGRHRRFVPDDVRVYGDADRRQPAARRLASHRPDRFICPAVLYYPFAAVQGPPTGWCTARSKRPACVWRNGYASCRWATSASGIWPTSPRHLMGDVNRMEHVWRHVLGYLYGAYISTAIIAVCCSFTTGGWPSPACGACRWLSDCCSAAGGWPPRASEQDEKSRCPSLRRHPGRRWRMCGRSAPQSEERVFGRTQQEN